MDTHFGGLLQPTYMEKFREGPYDEASASVQEAWKMVMMKFLPKICKGWGKGISSVLLSDNQETTKEMEALVCWYVDMYGDSRWEPEHRKDEEMKSTGATLERRGKRAGEAVKELRKTGPSVFMKYWHKVKERRAGTKDWETALQDAAKEEHSVAEEVVAGDGSETESAGQQKKKRKKQAPEPTIPTFYRFTDDGQVIEVAEAAAV